MAFIQLERVSFEYPSVPIEAQSLKVSFLNILKGKIHPVRQVRAIDDLSLVIHSGERVGVRGPNGAGKTSLLRILASIFRPTVGVAIIEEQVNPLLGLGAGINLEMSADSNIRLLLRIDGIVPEPNLVNEIWEFTEIADEFRDLPLRTFSSGMLMRLLFAAATTRPSPILIMDEWLSVGDASFIEKATLRLKSCIDAAKILVLASHSDSLLESLCTRIITLKNGKIVEDRAM
jgi:lipopolysaccharide transport system ATP-binding protein